MNIIAIMAHGHDVPLFCAGTLRKYQLAGHKVFIALTTGDSVPAAAQMDCMAVLYIGQADPLSGRRLYLPPQRNLHGISAGTPPLRSSAALSAGSPHCTAPPPPPFRRTGAHRRADHTAPAVSVCRLVSPAGYGLYSGSHLPAGDLPSAAAGSGR